MRTPRLWPCPHCGQEFTSKNGVRVHVEHPYCRVLREKAQAEQVQEKTEPPQRRWVNNPRISTGGATVWMRNDDG